MTLSVIRVQNIGSQVQGGFCRNHSPRPEHTNAFWRTEGRGGVKKSYTASFFTCRRRPLLSQMPPRLNLQEKDGERGNDHRVAQMGVITTPLPNLIRLRCVCRSHFFGTNSVKGVCVYAWSWLDTRACPARIGEFQTHDTTCNQVLLLKVLLDNISQRHWCRKGLHWKAALKLINVRFYLLVWRVLVMNTHTF